MFGAAATDRCAHALHVDALDVDRAPAAPVSGDQVNIDSFAFVPATLTVTRGSTVTWTNHDEEPHTVAANDGSFRSPGMGTGGHLLAHLLHGWNVRLRLLHSPDDARDSGGDAMTRDPQHHEPPSAHPAHGMVRRRGRFRRRRRRGHLTRRRRSGRACPGPAHPAFRPSQRQPHRVLRCAKPERRQIPSATRSIRSTTSATHRIS